MDEVTHLTDTATAALVEACPVRVRVVVARPAWVDPPSPVAVSRDATLAHTGADPPPGGCMRTVLACLLLALPALPVAAQTPIQPGGLTTNPTRVVFVASPDDTPDVVYELAYVLATDATLTPVVVYALGRPTCAEVPVDPPTDPPTTVLECEAPLPAREVPIGPRYVGIVRGILTTAPDAPGEWSFPSNAFAYTPGRPGTPTVEKK